MKQHFDKQNMIMRFVGENSRKKNVDMQNSFKYTRKVCNWVQTARYFGAQQHRSGRNYDDVHDKLRRSKVVWMSLFGCWRSSAPWPQRRMIFMGGVGSSFIEGMERLVLSKGEMLSLEKQLMLFVRKFKMGQGTKNHFLKEEIIDSKTKIMSYVQD